MRQRWHLREKINRHILEIDEKGLRYKFELMSSMAISKKILKGKDKVAILDVDSVQGVFLLWVFGCVAGVTIFVVELLLKSLGKIHL